MKENITILCPSTVRGGGLHYFYSLFPLLRRQQNSVNFDVTNSLDFCLDDDKNRSLLIVRYLTNDYKFNNIDTSEVLTKLRDKYENLAIFDDGDRACIDFPYSFPYVDDYFVSQMFSDPDDHKRPVKRGQLYSEYFAERGISDGEDIYSVPVDDEALSKIHLAWNIGAGCYPRNNLLRQVGLIAAKIFSPGVVSFFYNDPSHSTKPVNGEKYDVQARFSPLSVPSAGYQRDLVQKKAETDNRILTGFVKPRQYREELENSKIVVSPFGWGEVCFRDFEAILNGALLLKPDMSHIKTWPDIYIPYETYVPMRWDGEDMKEKIDEYLKDKKKRKMIIENAFKKYMQELCRLNDKVVDVSNIIQRN